MSIDATFLNITITLGHNTGKVTSYKVDKKKQYMYIFNNFDNVPGLACYITHAKNTPNFNKILKALRTLNILFEIGPIFLNKLSKFYFS